MWLILAFVSATFLGFYDTSKKASLKNNAVLPVLMLNTIFSTLIFSPFLIEYLTGAEWFARTPFSTSPYACETGCSAEELSPLRAHALVILKSFIVPSSSSRSATSKPRYWTWHYSSPEWHSYGLEQDNCYICCKLNLYKWK